MKLSVATHSGYMYTASLKPQDGEHQNFVRVIYEFHNLQYSTSVSHVV